MEQEWNKRNTLLFWSASKRLKKWSGRWDSNPRRPAWEIDIRLKIQEKASPGVNRRRLQATEFPITCSFAPRRGAKVEQKLSVRDNHTGHVAEAPSRVLRHSAFRRTPIQRSTCRTGEAWRRFGPRNCGQFSAPRTTGHDSVSRRTRKILVIVRLKRIISLNHGPSGCSPVNPVLPRPLSETPPIGMEWIGPRSSAECFDLPSRSLRTPGRSAAAAEHYSSVHRIRMPAARHSVRSGRDWPVNSGTRTKLRCRSYRRALTMHGYATPPLGSFRMRYFMFASVYPVSAALTILEQALQAVHLEAEISAPDLPRASPRPRRPP
jgi:hypothetical protein